MILANRWFLTRLQELDNPLFGTEGDKKKGAAAKKGMGAAPKKKEVSTYSRICAAHEDRMPAVRRQAVGQYTTGRSSPDDDVVDRLHAHRGTTM